MRKAHLKKVPYVEQMQQTECGLCCMAMILSYYGSRESLAEIREELDVGRDGLKLSQLYGYALKRNMYSKVYRTNVAGLADVPLPAIIFWKEEHYIVLEKIGRTSVSVVDPGIGRIRMGMEEFINGYSGVVMVLLPEEEFEIRNHKSSVWKRIFQEFIIKSRILYKTAGITLAAYAIQLLLPITIQRLFDMDYAIFRNHGWEQYVWAALAVIAAYSVVSFWGRKSLIRLQLEMDRYLTRETFSKMMKLPYKFFESRSNGDLLFRLNCLSMIRDLLSDNIVRGIIQGGFVIIIFLYMFGVSPVMAAAAVLLLGSSGLFILCMRPKIIEANQHQIIENTKLQSIQIETVQTMFGIKTAGIEREFYHNWKERYKKGMETYRKKGTILNIYTAILNIFQIIGPFWMLWLGAMQSMAGHVTVGEAIACYSLAGTVFTTGTSLFHMWNDFTIASSYMERVKDITEAKEESSDQKLKPVKTIEEIEFQNVSLRYTGNSPFVVKDVSFQIKKGEKVAIVGSSGSGKSSLLKLLLGLYHPDEGTIWVNHMDLRELSKGQFRKCIGIVPQEICLFNKSILENIRMNDERITQEQVIEAAKAAQIHEEIQEMPMQYHTMVSNMGMNLSGGQRQRIVLARAIAKNPQIMVLDEATSSLDNINEKKLSSYFQQNGKTQIIIAHRLSTIQEADKIIVMDQGTIAECGTHHQLMQKNGLYAQLYKTKKEERKEA